MLPTLDMWEVLHGAGAAVGFHLYPMAQPPGLPEQMISASAEAFFSFFLEQDHRDGPTDPKLWP